MTCCGQDPDPSFCPLDDPECPACWYPEYIVLIDSSSGYPGVPCLAPAPDKQVATCPSAARGLELRVEIGNGERRFTRVPLDAPIRPAVENLFLDCGFALFFRRRAVGWKSPADVGWTPSRAPWNLSFLVAGLGGGKSPVKVRITELFVKHSVPAELAESRANSLMTAVGGTAGLEGFANEGDD